MIVKTEAWCQGIQLLIGNLSYGFFYVVRDFATVASVLKSIQRNIFWEQVFLENLMSTYGRAC